MYRLIILLNQQNDYIHSFSTSSLPNVSNFNAYIIVVQCTRVAYNYNTSTLLL